MKHGSINKNLVRKPKFKNSRATGLPADPTRLKNETLGNAETCAMFKFWFSSETLIN